jgi:dsDNA-binding SOS-regulon protein
MHDDEFVFAVIPDHVSAEDRWDKILQKADGKTALERAVHSAHESKAETGVDLVIVLSSNEAVLDAATDLGAVSNLVPSFFNSEVMLKTYFSDPGVSIDPGDDPWIVVIDPYSLEHSAPRQMSEITAS